MVAFNPIHNNKNATDAPQTSDRNNAASFLNASAFLQQFSSALRNQSRSLHEGSHRTMMQSDPARSAANNRDTFRDRNVTSRDGRRDSRADIDRSTDRSRTNRDTPNRYDDRNRGASQTRDARRDSLVESPHHNRYKTSNTASASAMTADSTAAVTQQTQAGATSNAGNTDSAHATASAGQGDATNKANQTNATTSQNASNASSASASQDVVTIQEDTGIPQAETTEELIALAQEAQDLAETATAEDGATGAPFVAHPLQLAAMQHANQAADPALVAAQTATVQTEGIAAQAGEQQALAGIGEIAVGATGEGTQATTDVSNLAGKTGVAVASTDAANVGLVEDALASTLGDTQATEGGDTVEGGAASTGKIVGQAAVSDGNQGTQQGGGQQGSGQQTANQMAAKMRALTGANASQAGQTAGASAPGADQNVAGIGQAGETSGALLASQGGDTAASIEGGIGQQGPTAPTAPTTQQAATQQAQQTNQQMRAQQQQALAAQQQLANAVAALRRAGDGSHRATVELHPQELGTVRVEVQVVQGVVNVQLNAQEDSTRSLLAQHMDQLRDTLTDAGFSSGNLDVGGNDTPDEQGQSSDAPSGLAANDEEEELISSVPITINQTNSDSGLDLKV